LLVIRFELSVINAMSTDEFVTVFADVSEHSPWVAEEAAPDAAGTDKLHRIAEIMADCVDNASTERQLALIRAHPDLAGKAQITGELTQDSSDEQAGAGLDQCSAEEYQRFQSLNDEYHEKFGFPFVVAVRGSSRAEILEMFARRLDNTEAIEFETALSEIHKIARLRIEALEPESDASTPSLPRVDSARATAARFEGQLRDR
jgi:2-oxo-4-hydroxy-4-carboxy-5-ureidoimidazoline decarboxylase